MSAGGGNGMGEDRLAAAASDASCTAAPAGTKDELFDTNCYSARNHTCNPASPRKTHSTYLRLKNRSERRVEQFREIRYKFGTQQLLFFKSPRHSKCRREIKPPLWATAYSQMQRITFKT